MILAADLENTTLLLGGLEDGEIRFRARLAADRQRTEDQYALELGGIMGLYGFDPRQAQGAILSSEVPQLTQAVRQALGRLTGKKVLLVGPGLKNGLRIRTDDPAQLGSDRVADAVAAVQRYPLPLCIVNLGTATTLSVVDRQGSYLGGAIMPGVQLAVEALSHQAAQLPSIGLRRPGAVIGRNTVDSMVSGALYGAASMIDGMVDRVREELGLSPGETLTVIATGAMAGQVAPLCRTPMQEDPDLLLRGLWLIYQKNQRPRRSGEAAGCNMEEKKETLK